MSRVLLVSGVLLFVSALSVIYVRHLNRTVFVQQQAVYVKRDQLNIEWSKLLIEQATWSVLRIEDKARKDLDLRIPSIEQTQFIWTGEREDG